MKRKKMEIMITSGGTISKIDDVRHIGNFSNGTTAMYIAESFLEAGDIVHYVYAKGARRPLIGRLTVNGEKNFDEEIERLRKEYLRYQTLKPNLSEYPFETFEEYYQIVKSVLTSKKIDVAVLAAAVSDYSAVKKEGKISSDLDKVKIELVKNPKVISLIKSWNPNIFQVGFKLLSNVDKDYLIETAYQHGLKNNSDLTVGNSIYGNFGNRIIYIITPEKENVHVSERELSGKLVDMVRARINNERPRTIMGSKCEL